VPYLVCIVGGGVLISASSSGERGAPSSLEEWFYLTDASVAAGDVSVIDDGQLVLKILLRLGTITKI
jgi:hypothetical protein